MNAERAITVVGAGLMGTAIATLCAAHGYRVVLCDSNASVLETVASRALPIAQCMSGSSQTADDILTRVECNSSLQHSVRNAFLVQETIHEDLEAKRELFGQLDTLCARDVILATNTSSFLLSDICENIPGRERTIGIHYVSPPHLIRAVEIITASFTDAMLIERAREFVASIDHVGIVCRERPGFLINRIQYALKAEVQKLVEERVASASDIDAAVRLSIGPRLALWGPMMQEDLAASKKTVLAVSEYLHRATGEDHFASTSVLQTLTERGQIGAMAGAGWYKWDGNHEQRVRERDRQLGELLSWLKQNGRLDALGVKGENEDVYEGNPMRKV